MTIHGYDTGKNWMQYSADHVATTALLLSQNGLRSNLRASMLQNLLGEHTTRPPYFVCLYMHTCTSHIYVTPLLKILATVLHYEYVAKGEVTSHTHIWVFLTVMHNDNYPTQLASQE